MKISYAITVCNELEEIKRLIPFLIENKDVEDEVIILFDEKNGSEEVLDFLLKFNILPKVQTWRGFGFKNDFALWKNKLNDYCTGDYIFQLDADEVIDKFLIKNIKMIVLENPETELYYIPRTNIVDGITEDHIKNWGWVVDDKNRINFPDYQGRLYKRGLKWVGEVHERVVGAKFYSLLPTDEEFCIKHRKSIVKQEKQNNFYTALLNKNKIS